MSRRRSLVLGVALAAGAVAGTGVGFSIVAGNPDGMPIHGPDRDRATAAALAVTGGGRIIEAEVGEPAAHYVVEVKKFDGSVVEVGLDEAFRVTAVSAD